MTETVLLEPVTGRTPGGLTVLERRVRLWSGLILFAFAASHLASHAIGVFRLETLEAVGRGVILAPWRTPPGRALLFAALFVHGGLGLVALFRRRHLRMPRLEAVQLGLGLVIPLLLIPHVSNVRLGAALFGLDDSYYRIVYQYWISAPYPGLLRQFLLMLVLWTHGCIGLYLGLRFRPWFRRWQWGLLGFAALLPVLAVLGITNAGWDAMLRSAIEPGFARAHGPPAPGSRDAANRVALEWLWTWLQATYAALVLAVVGWRAYRNWYARRFGGVRIEYQGAGPVSVPRGFTILEASRFAGIAHTSICGGKARCSTCRVHVLSGAEALPAPGAIERATLSRIRAPATVRLACQTRPVGNVAIRLPYPVTGLAAGTGFALEDGRELTVTALSIDLRESTRLAAGRLPFDAVHILDRYLQTLTHVIEANRGYVSSVAGDGIMCIFGLHGNPGRGAREGLAAAARSAVAVEQLGRELADELAVPLRIGMGLHTGVAVVGAVAIAGRRSLQFLGDTGNVASRLEAMTKIERCDLIASSAVYETAAQTPPAAARHADVEVAGRDGPPLPVVMVVLSGQPG